MLLIIFLLNSLLITLAQEDACSWNLEVETDFTPNDCYSRDKKLRLNYYYTTENCLPVCKKFQLPSGTRCTQDKDCMPGFSCIQCRNRLCCQFDPSKCAAYYVPILNEDDTELNDYFRTLYRPICDRDGSWAPKQCKGEAATGRCFCYDKTGHRIFGQEWSNKAQNMTCDCSRRKMELRAAGDKFFVSLHCDSMGNYEPLQCDVEHGLCWCAENKYGDLKSIIVPISAMNRLPCYNAKLIGSQYLRQCDSLAYAQANILNKFKLHGSKDLSFGPLLCDEDGTYGQYRVQDGIAYCTWKDNSNIQTWQSPATTDLDKLNCNCARDSKIFAMAGKTLTQYCNGNGNYQTFQTIGMDLYCVDNDGYKKNYEPIEKEDDCDNFNFIE